MYAPTPDEAHYLEHRDALERIRWGSASFPGRVLATSSFGVESAVLLHLLVQAAPEVPVAFLDTGFHFPETHAFRAELEARLGVRVRSIEPRVPRERFLAEHGPAYRTDPELCCGCNKVEPMQRALQGIACWISGLRRDQAPTRRHTPVWQPVVGGTARLHPIADWSQEAVSDYLARHDLPVHPLAHEGYTSIGCAPCTRPPDTAGDRRSGRWAGQAKTECGIHLIGAPEQARPTRA